MPQLDQVSCQAWVRLCHQDVFCHVSPPNITCACSDSLSTCPPGSSRRPCEKMQDTFRAIQVPWSRSSTGSEETQDMQDTNGIRALARGHRYLTVVAGWLALASLAFKRRVHSRDAAAPRARGTCRRPRAATRAAYGAQCHVHMQPDSTCSDSEHGPPLFGNATARGQVPV